MDEPFGALDPITRDSLQSEMTRIHGETGKTIVFVTHDMDEALRLATRVVVLNKGSIVQAASPRDLLANPADDFVRAFLGKDDFGLRLLSVRNVRERVRVVDIPCGPETVGPDDNLRVALSRMLAMKGNRIAVFGVDGVRIGTVFLEDLVP